MTACCCEPHVVLTHKKHCSHNTVICLWLGILLTTRMSSYSLCLYATPMYTDATCFVGICEGSSWLPTCPWRCSCCALRRSTCRELFVTLYADAADAHFTDHQFSSNLLCHHQFVITSIRQNTLCVLSWAVCDAISTAANAHCSCCAIFWINFLSMGRELKLDPWPSNAITCYAITHLLQCQSDNLLHMQALLPQTSKLYQGQWYLDTRTLGIRMFLL